MSGGKALEGRMQGYHVLKWCFCIADVEMDRYLRFLVLRRGGADRLLSWIHFYFLSDLSSVTALRLKIEGTSNNDPAYSLNIIPLYTSESFVQLNLPLHSEPVRIHTPSLINTGAFHKYHKFKKFKNSRIQKTELKK
jgi:hypothetical protein